MTDVSKQFDDFVETITLAGSQTERMESAVAAISALLQKHYGVGDEDIFLQGSVPNGTAVEPTDGGEYDVDVVCICATADESADAALDELEAVFKENDNYASRLKRKTPCVRLEYAEDSVGKFHVDVVPVKRAGTMSPPLNAPRRGDGWHGTAPAEYTEWCQQQGELYSRTVKAAKRWRDEQQSVRDAIKSIVLQVLVSRHMPVGVSDDAQRFATTLQNMSADLARFSTPPELLNPVLRSENLAKRWTQNSYVNFKSELKVAAEVAAEAVAADSVSDACDRWRALLGDDFPLGPADAAALVLSDRSHVRSTNTGSWYEDLDPRYQVTISALYQRGRRDKYRKPYNSLSKPIISGNWIRFQAHASGVEGGSIWWQVANTGGHARNDSALRGDFLTAKAQGIGAGASSDPSVHWEHTKYTGVHLVRALIVVGNRVVARSDFLSVRIVNPRVPFTP